MKLKGQDDTAEGGHCSYGKQCPLD